MKSSQIKTIHANGLQFAFFEEGKGPLVLCLHGFPDTAHTWLELMPQIARLGFRVVAPHMRGYAPTEAPKDGNYSAQALGEDVLALIDALGATSAIVIGHDWGALAAYMAANLSPEKVSKLVTLAIPHPRSISSGLRTLIKAHHFVTFQFRKRAIRKFLSNEQKYVESIYRRWSPGWAFKETDLAEIKMAFRNKKNVEAALGYYWSYADSRRNRDPERPSQRRTSVPTLTLVGDQDGALDLDAMEKSPEAFTGPYNYEIIAGSGHFLHREKPDIVFEKISKFLR